MVITDQGTMLQIRENLDLLHKAIVFLATSVEMGPKQIEIAADAANLAIAGKDLVEEVIKVSAQLSEDEA